MKRHIQITLMMALVALSSCTHQELCDNHREHAHRYHINIVTDYRYDWEEHCGGTDWDVHWPDHYMPYESLRPGKPSGIRVVNSNNDGDYNQHNISADGGVVTLYEEANDILLYNNDTEYIIFSRNGDDATSTRATTRTRTRATYIGNEYANDNEKTVAPPDMLYANFIDDYIPEKVVEPTDVHVTLQPMVYTYKVRYEFAEGLKYVAVARGALSGMASSVYLQTGKTADEAATILYDCTVTDWGVRALVNSFGIPSFDKDNYPTRVDGENRHGLNLEVMLRNGKTVVFEFDVTDQVKAQPRGGVIVVDNIVITDNQGTSGSGAFDVEVDDWGPYEDIVLPL